MIHQYKSNGYAIVLDVNSGSVHVVDDIVYDCIALLDQGCSNEEVTEKLSASYSGEDLKTALKEIQELTDEGMLFTEDIYENAIEHFKERPTVVKALCLHIAHDCNLACKYCFAEEGEYHGRRALMSYEVGKKALDFLIANSGSRRNLEVDFFGGEPLMNWQVVKDLVAYGREQEKLHNKKFRFTLTTNGVLLNDEVMEFCNKEMGNVVLSVDGRKEVHDYMRPFRKGAGSYDLIIPKFQKFAESRNQDKYYVRGTFTHHNLDFSKDVLHLADLGFKQISVEPVVAADTEEYAIREEDIPLLLSVGKEHLYVWEKKEGILHENEGAEILYKICAGDSDTMHGSDIKEGKIELIADVDGVLKIRREALLAVNSLGEMMIASRHGNFPVKTGDKIAGTRIIPLVIEEEKMQKACEVAGKEPIFRILPYQKKKAGIVTTGSEVYYHRIEDKFTPVVIEKLKECGVTEVKQIQCNDDHEMITEAIQTLIEDGSDLIVCTGGMSVDPDDRTPLAIKNACTEVVTYGAPVLPGAMFMLAYCEKEGRQIPVMGLPGCVMYAKRTIFDLALPRLLADDEITAEELAALGEGGLCLNCEVCTFPNCGFGKGW